MSFSVYVPPHHCVLPNGAETVTIGSDNVTSQCLMYEDSNVTNRRVVECLYGWKYELDEEYEQTIPSTVSEK